MESQDFQDLETEHEDCRDLLLTQQIEDGAIDDHDDVEGAAQFQSTIGNEPPRLKFRLKTVTFSVYSSLRGWVQEESRKLIKLATPIFLALALQQAQLIVSMLYVGHITGSSLELDAIGLAVSLLHVTARSIAIGLSTAVDTLSSQAYGFKNYRRVGIILQRGLLMLSVMMFPIWAIWLNTETILLLFHQPPCVARLTALYMKTFCFSLPAWFVYVMVRQYLQAQGIVWTFVVVTFLSNVFSAIVHPILIYGLHLGTLGGAIALSLANSAPPVILIVYTWLRGLHKKTWYGWSWESLNQWGEFLKLGIPGLLMTCIPWWSTELTMFISGYISKTELAVNSVGFQILIFLFMVPLGIGISVSIRVGNELGAGNPKTAKRASYVAIAMALTIATVNTILLQLTKNHIGKLFTKDEEVIERIGVLMNLACVFQFSDEIQVTISGILRGSGRQYLAAIINFFCYTMLGLPVGVTLALKTNLRTIGLWTGLAVGNIIQAVAFLVVFLKTNWKQESEKAMKRARDKQHALRKTDSQTDMVELLDQQLQPDSNDQQASPKVDDNLNQYTDTRLDELNSRPTDHDDESSLGHLSTDDVNGDNDGMETNLLTPENDGEAQHSSGSQACHSTKVSDCTSMSGESSHQPCYSHSRKTILKSRYKLLLWRSSFYVLGLAILLAGGVLSQYKPHLNYYGNSTDLECLSDEENITKPQVDIYLNCSSIYWELKPTKTSSTIGSTSTLIVPSLTLPRYSNSKAVASQNTAHQTSRSGNFTS